jgi:hypothetical protein
MARPSKLTDKQWAEIERRNVSGESIRSLAKEFKVSPSIISERISERVPKQKELAKSIACVEVAFDSLTVSEQVSVRSLADTLKAISYHLGGAAKHGAMTAHRLSVIANAQVDRIDESAPLEENADTLKHIIAMTKGANDAASIGLNLLAANKDMARPEAESVPSGLGHFYGDTFENEADA